MKTLANLFGILSVLVLSHAQAKPHYTLIHKAQTKARQQQANTDINKLINTLYLKKNHPPTITNIIIAANNTFSNRPYIFTGAMGESNWCNATLAKSGCPHLQQDPLYQTQAFDCTTWVQDVLALINAKTLHQYQQNYIHIAYSNSRHLDYYHRNHFISSDFNRINEQHGLLKDITATGFLKKTAKTISTTIDKNSWLAVKSKQPYTTLRVFSPAIAKSMLKQFNPQQLKSHRHSKPQTLDFNYIPKDLLAYKTKNNHYRANMSLIDQLATPAVAEVTRNPKHWTIQGENIKTRLGSNLLVSHLGLLYKKTFNNKDIIYQKITCHLERKGKVCAVNPIRCNNPDHCTVTLFSNATAAYPNNYYYFKDVNGHYHCQAEKPPSAKGPITHCNRVNSLPLAAYITQKEYGHYNFMQSPSIVGLHLEKIMRS